MEEFIVRNLMILWPWLLVILVAFVFLKLLGWAKNRKTGALVFAALVQMVMPDPYAERTIKVVQEDKKETKKEVDGNSQLEK